MHKLIVHNLIVNKGKILLIKRSYKSEDGSKNIYGGYWDFPGGKVRDKETPREALIREAREEIGIDVNVVDIFYEFSNYIENKDYVYTTLVYLSQIDIEDEIRLSDEHTDYMWITAEDLLNSNIDCVLSVRPSIEKLLFSHIF